MYTDATIKAMLRVDLAGEMAAVRICEAQRWWLSPLDPSMPIIDEILSEEVVHRAKMRELSAKYSAPETVFDPLFRLGAFAMGVGTAVLGKEAVMCCHAAVEDTITEHYNDQLRELSTMTSDATGVATVPVCGVVDPPTAARAELVEVIAKFRDEEQHHKELGERNGAASAPFYPLLYPAIQTACRFGIAVASRF